MPLTLFTGGVRSGKSARAQALALRSGGRVTYVATARRNDADAEWERRIERHRADRPKEWRTVETAGFDAQEMRAMFDAAFAEETLLVDSLGTWLADRDLSDEEAAQASGEALVDAMLRSRACVIVVSEETGWGIVPEYASGRVFRDVLGRLNQRAAAGARDAYLVVCGRTIPLTNGDIP